MAGVIRLFCVWIPTMARKRNRSKARRTQATTSKAAASPQQQEKKRWGVGTSLQAALLRNQPGAWASDHRAEAEHVTDWNYIAIRSICLQAMQATVFVFDDSGPTGPARKAHRQYERQQWRNDPSKRMQYRPYWHKLKSLYGQDNARTSPLPDDSLIVRLQKYPNEAQSGAMFRYEQVMQLQSTGTCIVWNVPNVAGKTVARHVVPTAVAQPVQPNPDLPRGGFRVDPSCSRYRNPVDGQGFTEMSGYFSAVGRVIPIEQCQIIRWPHPILKDDGYSPLAAGGRFIDTSDQVNIARFAQMLNGFEPSFIYTFDGDTDPDQDELDEAAKKLQQKYGGAANSRKVLLLPSGRIVTLNTTPKDMDYSSGFEQTRNAVLALQGTPPVMAGIQEAGAFAAYYASLKQGISLTVQPILDLLAEEDSRWFAARRPNPVNPDGWILEYPEGTTVEIEAAPIDDVDLKERQLSNDASWGIRTVDELRAERGLPLWGGERGNRIVGQGVNFPPAPSQTESSVPRPNLFQRMLESADEKPVDATQPEEETATNIASTVSLNGAQVTAALDVLDGVTGGTTSPVVARELLLALGIEETSVDRMVRAAEQQESTNAEADRGSGEQVVPEEA